MERIGLLLPILLLLLTSIGSVWAQTAGSPGGKIVFSNERHVVSYAIESGKIMFTMEAIADLTDDIRGGSGNSDFMGIDVDRDQNGSIDKNVDVAFTRKGTGIGFCPVFLIDSKRAYPCGSFPSEGFVELSFRKTAYGDKPHPVYTFTIPSSEVATAKDAIHLVFRFYESGKGYTYYPSRLVNNGEFSFASTIQIELK